MEGSRGDFSPAPGSASPMASATAKQQTAPVLVTTEPRVLGLRPSSFSSTHVVFKYATWSDCVRTVTTLC